MSKSPLRILQVNTFDIGGGAEKIAGDLFTSYSDQGHKSWLAVGMKKSSNENVFSIPRRFDRISRYIPFEIRTLPRTGSLRRKVDFFTNTGRIVEYIKGHEDFLHPGTYDLLKVTPERPDILHCHNLHGGYFDLRALPKLSRQIPTILTLHDAWLLSGHCAHSFDCVRWKTGCGNCPDLTIFPKAFRDATAYNWQRKAEIYKKCRLNIVTPSQWLMNKLNQSMVKNGMIKSRVIPNGVDLSIFNLGEKSVAREELKVPLDKKILLFAANSVQKDQWKDYQTLRTSLMDIGKRRADVYCIALGGRVRSEFINNIKIHFIPYQRNPEILVRYYRAADIYIHPARADTFPNMVLEAMACGTPVVASAIGGIPEQVVDGRTGFLVPVGNASEMAGRINELLDDDKSRLRMGQEAAKDVKRRFGREKMVQEYLTFYNMILEEECI